MPVILTVEDDKVLSQLNARLLKRQGYDVLSAYTAAEARELAADSDPDLLILDVMLPDGDGLSLCSEFRATTDAPILFLTGRTEVSDKINGLHTGGDYYLTKPYDKEEFLAVVETLLRRASQNREKLEGVAVITKGSISLKVNERKALVDGVDAALTAKEFAILHLLVQNEGKELSYESIYETVWGAPMYGDLVALRKQVSRLKKKLDENNARDFAIFNDHGKGYTFSMM